jgi:2-methylisocitrate lyase-like PEP mutase family enzyme
MSTLAELVASRRPLIAPSMYDGISARLVAQIGFDAAYIGSYATGATKYGVPDLGYIGRDDMVDQVRRLAPIVDVPIIVDGEGGFGNPLHVARTIRELERAGAAGVHIEDHEFGKHLAKRPHVIALDQAVDKIKAAVDARTSPDFWVIARSDSLGILGAQGAIERCVAFEEAGADAVMVPGLPLRDVTELKRQVRVPFVNINTPGQSPPDAAEAGTDVLLYFGLTHFVAQDAIRAALEVLKAEGSTAKLDGALPYIEGFDSFLGIDTQRAEAVRYGLIDSA